MKGRYLRSIVNSVDQDELQFVLNAIVKNDRNFGVGGCDTFMRHVHQDAFNVMDTYVAFLVRDAAPQLVSPQLL